MPKLVPLSHGQQRPSVYERHVCREADGARHSWKSRTSRDAESIDYSVKMRVSRDENNGQPSVAWDLKEFSVEVVDEEWEKVFKPPKRTLSCPHLSSLVQGPTPWKAIDDIVKEAGESKHDSDAGLLIPGLTNDLAMVCLARLPYSQLGLCRGVCSLWRQVLASEDFNKVRDSEGTTGTSFCICLGVQKFGKKRGIVFKALDFHSQAWFQLPPLYLSNFSLWRPGGSFDNFSGFEVVGMGRKLVVLGGAFHMPGDPLTEQRRNHRTQHKSSDVWAFDSVQYRWTALPSMTRARSMFAAAALDSCRIVVAAGSRMNATAEILDLRENFWAVTENMPYPGEKCRGVAKDGLFYVIWHRHPFHGARLVHVYDPDNDTWSTISGFFPSTGSLESSQSVAVLNGFLYATQGELQASLGGDLSVLRNKTGGTPVPANELMPHQRQLAAMTSGGLPPGVEWEPVARLPRKLRERKGDEEFSVQGHFLVALGGKLIIVQTVVHRKVRDESEETFLAKEDEKVRPLGFMSILSPPWWEAPKDTSVLAWEVKDVQISSGIVACAALSI